jgi:hypothetical protein
MNDLIQNLMVLTIGKMLIGFGSEYSKWKLRSGLLGVQNTTVPAFCIVTLI